ncbi:hypothetical protein AB0B25_22875 [Nocardia sp. NPDC049190]|uniref:hypothetical protein n=1 Tax=Nocardia sp. NPDC049190 TaxID=3155650 RepID=UPI0033CCE6D8
MAIPASTLPCAAKSGRLPGGQAQMSTLPGRVAYGPSIGLFQVTMVRTVSFEVAAAAGSAHAVE